VGSRGRRWKGGDEVLEEEGRSPGVRVRERRGRKKRKLLLSLSFLQGRARAPLRSLASLLFLALVFHFALSSVSSLSPKPSVI